MDRSLLTPRRMTRFLLLMALCWLAFGQVAPAFEAGAAAQEACGQSCPGEDADGGCDPLCDSCVCCSLSPQAPAQTVGSAPIFSAASHDTSSKIAPLSPEPSGILHVPKSRLT